MLKKLLKRTYHEEKGITGLETAIILIAFVVVASVFAYTVLTAGIFAAERGEEAVYAGLEGARASVVTVGGVIGETAVVGGNVTRLVFTVANAVGGEPINFVPPIADNVTGRAGAGSVNVVVISYIDLNQHVPNLAWTFTPLGENDGDNLLEPREKFQITVGVGPADGLITALAPDLGADRTFTIKIKPPVGAVLTLERTIPPRTDRVMNLN
jgi:flagellin FlaB